MSDWYALCEWYVLYNDDGIVWNLDHTFRIMYELLFGFVLSIDTYTLPYIS